MFKKSNLQDTQHSMAHRAGCPNTNQPIVTELVNQMGCGRDYRLPRDTCKRDDYTVVTLRHNKPMSLSLLGQPMRQKLTGSLPC